MTTEMCIISENGILHLFLFRTISNKDVIRHDVTIAHFDLQILTFLRRILRTVLRHFSSKH